MEQHVFFMFPVICTAAGLAGVSSKCLTLMDASPPGFLLWVTSIFWTFGDVLPLNMGKFLLLATCYLLYWTHVLRGYAILATILHLTFMSWWTMTYSLYLTSACQTTPCGLFWKVQLAMVPEALHDCHWYFSKGWRFGRACLGFSMVGKVETGVIWNCRLKIIVWHHVGFFMGFDNVDSFVYKMSVDVICVRDM